MMIHRFLVLIAFSIHSVDPKDNETRFMPWGSNQVPMVSIQQKLDNGTWIHICSGVNLYRKDHVALIGFPTHCYDYHKISIKQIRVLPAVDGIDTHVNELNLNSAWEHNDPRGEGDFAIFKAHFTGKPSDALLPYKSNFSDLTMAPYLSNCSIYGWPLGSIVQKSDFPIVKPVEVLPQVKCQDEWGDFASIDSKICILSSDTAPDTPCPNDPGSLLFCDDAFKGHEKYFMGMASAGPEYCGNSDVSALYTNILVQQDFFVQILAEYL